MAAKKATAEVTSTSLITVSKSSQAQEVTPCFISRDDAVFISLSCSIYAAAVPAEESWLLRLASGFHGRERWASNELAVVG